MKKQTALRTITLCIVLLASALVSYGNQTVATASSPRLGSVGEKDGQLTRPSLDGGLIVSSLKGARATQRAKRDGGLIVK